MTLTYDKTEKGREEIATRKHQLPSRLRTLLVMVDGKHNSDDLLKKVAGLGLNAQSLEELLTGEFIHALQAPEVLPPAPEAAPEAVAPIELPTGETQFAALYHFYTETIKSTIGLRGYGLQLKVEKAGTIEDFRALRPAYLEAVLKAKGNDVANELRTRLDQILALGA